MRITHGKLLILEAITAVTLTVLVPLVFVACSDTPKASETSQTAHASDPVDTTWITCVDAAHDTAVYVADGHEFSPSTLFYFTLHDTQKKMNVWNQSCTWQEPK